MLYKRKIFAILAACVALLSKTEPSMASIKINEVMPCNLSTVMNSDNYNFSGYIELKNDGEETLLIKGYTLIHYKKGSKKYSEKWTWNIDKNFIIESNEFITLWADESELSGHIPFKLDADGGYILLKNGDELIDSLMYEPMVPRISYGRYNGETGYMNPTPDEENTYSFESLKRCNKPMFSEEGGIVETPFDLELSNLTNDAKIYYTTDGSEPNQSSTLYEERIPVTENICIRAIAYAEDMLPSKIETNTYIFEDEKHSKCGGFSVPIVAITVDEKYFYDDYIGICVEGKNGINGEKDCTYAKANYNQDWKRPINLEYIVDGKQEVSQELETKVVGGCSKTDDIKSLALKATKKSGSNIINYNFFKSKPNVTHQTLHLRNGGTASSSVKFRDGFMQTFATSMSIDYQAYQPVAYYLNGEYMGLMALNERTNADYLKANYDIDEEDVEFITVSDQLGINASLGTLDAYNSLIDYVETEDNTTKEFYDEICKRIDINEYVDYQIFQQFIVNTDWPGNNTKIWRKKGENTKFRWIVFDTDFGFGYSWPASLNMIEWCQGKGITSWANEDDWMTTLFKHISENQEFKRKFTTRYLIHLSTTFNTQRIEAIADSMSTLLESEYCADKNASASTAIKTMKSFAIERTSKIPSHLKSYAGTGSTASLTLNSNIDNTVFTINGETVKGFEGNYLQSFGTDFKAYPPQGYKFSHWEISPEDAFEIENKTEECKTNMPGVLTGTMQSECIITAVFENSDYQPTLVINELCASNDSTAGIEDKYGNYPDWIEIYNYGADTLEMAGMHLSNNEKEPVLSRIPYGYNETLIAPNEHKLLWANSDTTKGALYLNFNLNVDKSKTVYLNDKDGATIAKGTYNPHETNESYGWETDNDGDWLLFGLCNNKSTSTPGYANLWKKCDEAAVDEFSAEQNNHINVYPNPIHGSELHIVSDSELSEISISNINGQAVIKFETDGMEATVETGKLEKGIYILKVRSYENNYVTKLIKE